MKILEDSSIKILSIISVLALFASAAMVASFRPANAASSSANAGIVIPLYTYPTDGTWTQVMQAKQAYPNVPFIAIINPNSGPGSSQDPNFVQGINNLRAAGITVLGYVATGYAVSSYSSISNLESQVTAYHNWYAVNGVLFDEMSNTPGYENYYSTLDSFVHSLGMSLTMGNPGTSVPSSYIGTLDALCIYESSGLPSLSFITYPGYSSSNFAVVALGVPMSTTFLTGASPLVSWFYLTDANGSNPYDVLPSYFTSEIAALSAIDGTVVTTTSSSSTTQASTTTSTTSTTSRSTTVSTTTHSTTSTTTSSSTTMSTTKTTTTSSSTPTVSVSSVDLSGASISGLWTTWNQGSTVLATGYTPITFDGSQGGSYVVSVANYQNYVFCHWQDGSTSADKTVSFGPSVSLVAYYSTNGSCSTAPAQVPVNIDSAYLNQTGFAGAFTTITTGGSTVASGPTPLSFNGLVGNSYTITISNHGTSVFDHWSQGGSSNSVAISPTSSTTLLALFRSPVTLSVRSLSSSGTTLGGVTATISAAGSTLGRGSTPLSSSVMTGTLLTVSVNAPSGWVFSHWQDGSTASSRTVTLTQKATLTAYFTQLAKTYKVTIVSSDLKGAQFTGMWLEVYNSNGKLVAEGYTSLTFTANAGAKYTVVMSNWQNYIFSHWDNGSTNPSRVITPTQATTLTAYYNT